MANAGEIRAGKAYVSIGVDNTELKKGLDAAKKELAGFSSSISSVFSKIGDANESLKVGDAAGVLTALFPAGRIAGIAAGVIMAADAFPSLAKKATDSFGEVGRSWKATWDGMVAATQANRLDLQFAIAVAQMKVIWTDFANWMVSTFPQIGNRILHQGQWGMAGMAAIIRDAFNGIAPVRGGAPGSMLRDMVQAERGQRQLGAMGLLPSAREELAEAVRRAREARDAQLALTDETRRGARGTFSSRATAGLVGAIGTGPVEQRLDRINSELIRANEHLRRLEDGRVVFQ